MILLVYGLLLPINPMFSRMQERAAIAEIDSNIQETNIVNENVLEESQPIASEVSDTPAPVNETPVIADVSENNYMIQYIENNYEDKQLNKQFLFDNYPYQYDPEFWYNLLHNNISLTTDYRYIELSMIRRVVELSNNPMDKWFGITNTRLQNIFNIEKDFVVQYYALRYSWNYISFSTILCNTWCICLQNSS